MELKPEVPTPAPRKQRVGYALVGLGKLTVEEILPATRTSEHSYVAALVTGEEDKGEAFARALGLTPNDVYTYDDFEKLGQRDDIEAVYIVLPNNLHREYALRAAKMGKHVLCEKPLAGSVEDAQAMVDACREAGVLLMTAYRCQYTPEHWWVREAVQSGKLGNLKVLSSVRTQVQGQNWRLKEALAGGGPLFDIGIYPLNMFRFLLGTEPQWVFAVSQPMADASVDVEETVSFMLGFEGGIVANIHTSYNGAEVSEMRVVGDQAGILMDPAFQYSGLQIELHSGDGTQSPKFMEYDQFTLEVDHFAACIRSGHQPWTPGEEGLQDQKIMAAIYESARTGKVVQLEKHGGKDNFRGEQKPKMPQPKVEYKER